MDMRAWREAEVIRAWRILEEIEANDQKYTREWWTWQSYLFQLNEERYKRGEMDEEERELWREYVLREGGGGL